MIQPGVKTGRHERRQWNRINFCCYPGQSPLMSHPPTGEISEHQAKNLIWPYLTSDELTSQSKSPPDLPWQQDLVTKIDVLGQDHRKNWCIAPAVSTISILPLSFLLPSSDEEEERHSLLLEQEVWGQETLEMGMLLQGSTLFIDGGTK